LAVADVTLGFWRPLSIWRQFRDQLSCQLAIDLTLPETAGPSLSPGSHADLIGAGIDGEARGHWPTMAAVDAAVRLANAANMTGRPVRLFVLCPRSGSEWPSEEAVFVRRVHRELGQTGTLVLIDVCESAEEGGPPPAPARSRPGTHLLSLIPSVIEGAWLESVGNPNARPPCLSLPGGYSLVDPQHRPLSLAQHRLGFDALALAIEQSWLVAYSQYHGNSVFVDSQLLAREAWQCSRDGSQQLAIRFLERASSVATGMERGLLLAQLQGLRIAAGEFARAATLTEVDPALPDKLRGFLLQSKGWGLVIGGDAESGCACLEQATSLLAFPAESREHQYLQNILALGRLKCGKIDEAVRLEEEIRARTTTLRDVQGRDCRDHRLEYVNALNLARLYRRKSEHQKALDEYQRAFATTAGLSSESDAVHRNVCLAKVHELLGDKPRALHYWLLAALHWVSSEAPEALGHRVIAAISPDANPMVPEFVELLSAALYRHVAKAFVSVGLAVPDQVSDPPGFIREDKLPPHGSLCCAIYGWWGMFGSQIRIPDRHESPSHAKLRELLLRSAIREFQRPLPPIGSLVVSDDLGQEVPTDEPSMLATSLRLGVRTMHFRDRSIELDVQTAQQVEQLTTIEVNPAVDRITYQASGATIGFKRYRAPETIDARSVEVLRRADSGDRRLDPSDLQCARRLERQRIVYLRMGGEACAKAGIKFSSSGI